MELIKEIFAAIVVMIFSIAFMLVGVVIFLETDSDTVKKQEFNKNAKTVDATVTKVERQSTYSKVDSSTSTKYYVYLFYKVDGVIYNDEYFTTATNEYEEGEIITIYYDSKNPSNVSKELYNITSHRIMSKLIPGVFALVGVVGIVYAIKMMKDSIKKYN